MFTFLVVLIALIAVLMILLVLVQSGKGGGLAGIAAGGATTQILGARQAPDILEKGTWVLAAAFIVLCILTNFTIGDREAQESVIQQRARGAQTQQTAPAPGASQGARGGAVQQVPGTPGTQPQGGQPQGGQPATPNR